MVPVDGGETGRHADARIGKDLHGALMVQKIEAVAKFLATAKVHGFAPLQASAGPPAPSTGRAPSEEDPEEAAGQRVRDREFRGRRPHDEPGPAWLILDVLILEALLRREVAADLVGLALSGGGIRSASFNLGLLQALQESQLLPEVDDLSTVSGGGYVGSLLSSLVHRRDINLCPGKGKEPPLAAGPDGRQPERVVQLVRSGSFLNKPFLHLSRYFLGVILNNVVLVSGLFAVCTLAAWLWRWLDRSVPVGDWYLPIAGWTRYYTGGFISDWNRPFLPALAVLLIWFVISAAALARSSGRGQPRVAPGCSVPPACWR